MCLKYSKPVILWRHKGLATLLLVICACAIAPAMHAAQNQPTGKVYVVDVIGSASLRTSGDGPIVNLTPKTVFKAEGSTIRTSQNSSVALLLSNGTSLVCNQSTSISIRKFSQNYINVPISNLDKEPSASQIQVYVELGNVSIATPELVQGSSQVFLTAQGEVNLKTGQFVIEASTNQTKVFTLSGEATVVTNSLDSSSRVKSGFQAILTDNSTNSLIPIELLAIPTAQLQQLGQMTAEATMARRVVFFTPASGTGIGTSISNAQVTSSQQDSQKQDQGKSIFDSSTSPSPAQELQAVPIVAVDIPVQFIVSPARIKQ